MKLRGSTSSILHHFALALVLTLMKVSLGAAQAPRSASELRVAVAILPPFVMQQNGSLTGFSIELWSAIVQLYNKWFGSP